MTVTTWRCAMCAATACEVCGKTTWMGCGDHIDAVKETVPAAEWCDGAAAHAAPESVSA